MSDEQPWRIDLLELIPLDKIDPDPKPLRKTLSRQHIDDILNSFCLFKTGPLDALLVKPMENDRYRIISGNHRYHALKQGGFKEAQCHIIEPLSDAEEFLMKLHANTHRKNLSDLERCEAMACEKDIYEAFYPETMRGKNKLTESVSPNGHFVGTVNPSYARLKAKELGVDPRTIHRDVQVGKIIQEIPQLKASEATKNDIYSLTKWPPAERRHLQDTLKVPENESSDARMKALDQAFNKINLRLNSKKRRGDSANSRHVADNPDNLDVHVNNPERCIRLVCHQLQLGLFWRNAKENSLKALVQEELLLKTAHLLVAEHRLLKKQMLHT